MGRWRALSLHLLHVQVLILYFDTVDEPLGVTQMQQIWLHSLLSIFHFHFCPEFGFWTQPLGSQGLASKICIESKMAAPLPVLSMCLQTRALSLVEICTSLNDLYWNMAMLTCYRIVCGWFWAKRAELKSYERDGMAHKAENIYCWALYGKNVCWFLI